MKNSIAKYWAGLAQRERMVLALGFVFVVLMLFYQFLWSPWHTAINYMDAALVDHRKNLVWMRQQSDLLDGSGGSISEATIEGASDSLMSIILKSAGAADVKDAIKGTNPRLNNTQVSVVLEEVSFNKWVRWVDRLQSNYGVSINQLSAEKENDKPDVAEIRVTFERK